MCASEVIKFTFISDAAKQNGPYTSLYADQYNDVVLFHPEQAQIVQNLQPQKIRLCVVFSHPKSNNNPDSIIIASLICQSFSRTKHDKL